MSFEDLWNPEGAEPPPEVLSNENADYRLKDGYMRYKNMANIFNMFFHAKYGEPIPMVKKPNEYEFELD
jgi:hypothetical protein